VVSSNGGAANGILRRTLRLSGTGQTNRFEINKGGNRDVDIL
jgi:hypothetical protein